MLFRCWRLSYFITSMVYSTAIDQILNEVIKLNDVMNLLYSLINNFFSSTLLPSLCMVKALFTPIPKRSSKYPYMPLHYRNQFTLMCLEGVPSCNFTVSQMKTNLYTWLNINRKSSACFFIRHGSQEQKFDIIMCEVNLINAMLCHAWHLHILFCVESGW